MAKNITVKRTKAQRLKATRDNLRRRIRHALKSNSKRKIKDVGCTPAELRAHLTILMTADMTWENYGRHWHIDHIEPLSAFNLKLARERKVACNYMNLMPLHWRANLSKGKKSRSRAPEALAAPC